MLILNPLCSRGWLEIHNRLPASASQVLGIIGTSHDAQLIFEVKGNVQLFT